MVSEETKDINEQLDTMLDQAAQAEPESADDADAPEGSFETADAVMDGDAFADQVQEMLDEASKSDRGEPAGQTADGDSEASLISEIDAMLAANADEAVEDSIEGDFETVEQVEQVEPAATEAATGIDDDEIEDAGVEPAVGVLEAERSFGAENESDAVIESSAAPDADELEGDFAGANEVAAELDEMADADIGMRSVEEMAATPQAAADDEAPAEASEPAEPKAGPLIGILMAINSPVMSLPAMYRDVVGCIAIGTVLLAMVLWIKALFGATAALMLMLPAASLLAVTVYFMLLRSPSPPSRDNAEPAA